MIVYYAIGGGLGHVTRARRVLAALQLEARVIGTADVPQELEQSVDAHREWIRALGADRIIADSFPLGIRGELEGIGVPLDHVARLLRWDAYRRIAAGPLPRFGTTWIVEPLAPDHDAAIRAASDRVIDLQLRPEEPEAPEAPEEPYWLVVHSGPADEVRELVAYAEERRAIDGSTARIIVATACDVNGVERANDPPSALYAGAERIVSAAGFNVMLETEAWRQKHDVIPFIRRFDDQFTRAARRRAANGEVEEALAAQQPAPVDDGSGQSATAATIHHAAVRPRAPER